MPPSPSTPRPTLRCWRALCRRRLRTSRERSASAATCSSRGSSAWRSCRGSAEALPQAGEAAADANLDLLAKGRGLDEKGAVAVGGEPGGELRGAVGLERAGQRLGESRVAERRRPGGRALGAAVRLGAVGAGEIDEVLEVVGRAQEGDVAVGFVLAVVAEDEVLGFLARDGAHGGALGVGDRAAPAGKDSLIVGGVEQR